jgi:PTH2 family peptidyl-tRNA hydrolase
MMLECKKNNLMKSYQVKQVIVMRKDLNMRKGKMIAQGSHASVDALLSMFNCTQSGDEVTYELKYKPDAMIAQWMDGSFAKICLYVNSEQELLDIYNRVRTENPEIPVSLITDAGFTEFHGVATNTCIAIGPYWDNEIDEFTGSLKLL